MFHLCRQRSLAVAASAIVLGQALVMASPDTTAAKCNPGRSNNHQTYWTATNDYVGSVVGGVYGKILNYSPWVEPGGGFDYAWVMLWSDAYSSRPWSQIGWYEQPYGVRYTLVQYSDQYGSYTNVWYNAQPAGARSTYEILYHPLTPTQSPYWTFEVNATVLERPLAQFVPNQAQASGEIKSLADQMPGGYSAHEEFSNLHIYYSGGWHTYVGSGSPPLSYFGMSALDSCTVQSYLDSEGARISRTSAASAVIAGKATEDGMAMFPGSRVAETVTGVLTSPREPVANGRKVLLLRFVNAAAIPPGGPAGVTSTTSLASPRAICTIVVYDATVGAFLYAVQRNRQ